MTDLHPRADADPATGRRNLYALLVASVRDYAVFAIDPKGYILSWNAGAERIKGYQASEIIGKHFSAFYPPEDIARGKPEWELKRAIMDGRVEDEDWRVCKEAGQIHYEFEEVPLHTVVDRVLTMVSPQAKLKHVTLTHGPCPESAVAWADRLKTEQIVLNLLSNAVKFTPIGGSITATCHASGMDSSITIQDTGPGIPRNKLESIFEPFVQLGRSLTSAHEGSGLGLAISRDLARAMNGNVTVESTPGHGSTFTLSLPSKTR